MALAAVLAVAGCGRRGALEAPPDPSAVAAPSSEGAPSIVTGRAKRVPIEHPKDAFVLDPLL